MARRRILERRSSVEWLVRIVLAAFVTILGCFGVIFSVAQVTVGKDPALAHRLAPYDGRITARLATSLTGDEATPADRRRADGLAKLALRQDPTAVLAASTLGLDAGIRGANAEARRYFAYAQRMSRRDLRTQLWMIEDAVGHGDIPRALHQYDITLRVFPKMGELLYPILASASADRSIRNEVVKTLISKPMWGENFINFVGANSLDPRSTAALFLALHRAGVVIPAAAHAGAMNALLATGQVDAVWSYYTSIRPGVDRRRSRDPRFAAKLEAPSQLDWIALDTGGLVTNIQDGIFDFTAPASVGGPMLQQLQMLPPGGYRLIGHSIGIEQSPNAMPYWALICQDTRELGRVEVPNSSVANGNFSGSFNVPKGCTIQTLVLKARPSDAVSGLSGQIDLIELVPTGK